MIAIQRILVPTDFSPQSTQALHWASVVAERFDADLHLLHVVQDLQSLISPEAGYVPGDYRAEMRKAAESALEKLQQSEWTARKPRVRSVREGTPFVEIIRYARDNEIDLIVMGTHGRGGLAHVLLGSVAERVVRKAPCPVLTVRPPEQRFVAP